MAWDDFPKFVDTSKRRGLGRIMLDAVDGAEGFKTKVMMVNGEKLTLRTRGGFPRIYGELTTMPVIPDPVPSGILQMFMVPSGEIGAYVTGSNGYYKLSTGEYVLRPYSSGTTALMFHESRLVDASVLTPITERQFGNLDWFDKANAGDAANPSVTWGFRSGGRHGKVPSILSAHWPTYSVDPSGQGIYLDGVLMTGSDKFNVIGAGRNAAGKVVAILAQGMTEASTLSWGDGSTTLISIVQDDAGSLDLSLGAPIAGWTEVTRKVMVPQYAFYQPIFINSSGTSGVTIARQKGGDPAVVTMDLTTLTFSSTPSWKWRRYTSGLLEPTFLTLSVPAGPTLNAGYEFPERAARYIEELEQVIAVDYDGDEVIKLTRFSRQDKHMNWLSPMTVKVTPPTFHSLPVTDALDENKAIIAGIVWDSGMVFSTSEVEAKAKAALSAGRVSYEGGAPSSSYGGSTVKTYTHSASGMVSSDVSVSLIDPAFAVARAGAGRFEVVQSNHTVGGRTYDWAVDTTSSGIRTNTDPEVFLLSSVITTKGAEQSSYADIYLTGMRLQKLPTTIVGPGPDESRIVDLNYVVVERSAPPSGSLNYYGTDETSLVTNTMRACDLRHKVFLVKQDNGSTKAFFSAVALDTPPAVTLAEQLATSGTDPGLVPDPPMDLGETVSQMTVHQGGMNLVYTDVISDQHTAYLCTSASPSPSPIAAPVPGALFVAPIYFRKSPTEE